MARSALRDVRLATSVAAGAGENLAAFRPRIAGARNLMPKMKSVLWVAAISLLTTLGWEQFKARTGVRR